MATTQSSPETALRNFRYLGNYVTVHADSSDMDGKCSVLEMHAFPGSEPPMHIHQNEDEIFIIIEGRMKLTCGGVERVLSPGESAIAKRGTPHTFKILTPSMRSFAIFTPGGFEDFFRGLAGDGPLSVERIGQLAAQYGTRLV
jgi:mannose-6-phosphate isomerase-like protein (cupin superfamily)